MPSIIVHHYGCDEKHAQGERCRGVAAGAYQTHETSEPVFEKRPSSYWWLAVPLGLIVELALLVMLWATALGAYDQSMGDPCLSANDYYACKERYEIAFWLVLGALIVIPIGTAGGLIATARTAWKGTHAKR